MDMENRKRKPLSDITNSRNPISTSVLRKLVFASNSNSILKPPITILKSSSSSRKPELYSGSSPTVSRSDAKSDTSIGSSNIDTTLRATTFRFQARDASFRPIISGEWENSNVNGQSTDKLNTQTESDTFTNTSTSEVKKNDKKKICVAPLNFSLPVEKTSSEIAISRHCSQKKLDKKDMDNLIRGKFEKTREIGKGILNSVCSTDGKIEKGKAILDYSDDSKEKTGPSGKQFIDSSNSSYDMLKSTGKMILELPDSSYHNTEYTKKAMDSSGSILVDKTMGKHKPLKSFGYHHDKTRNKKKAILNPLNKKNEKWKEAPSCPPMCKIKKMQNDLEITGIVKSSKVQMVASPKFRKKRCNQSANCLPSEFLEQQRAYFKEVDEFILVEEEISENELEQQSKSSISSSYFVNPTK